jgi:ABC-type transport system involved in cytochrome c biogenesis permease component
MLMRARARDVLLGILLYPVVLPLLIAGIRGSQALLTMPADLPTAWMWARLMLAYDAIFVVVSLWVYEPLIAGD